MAKFIDRRYHFIGSLFVGTNVEVGKDQYWWKPSRHAYQSGDNTKTRSMQSFSWSSWIEIQKKRSKGFTKEKGLTMRAKARQ